MSLLELTGVAKSYGPVAALAAIDLRVAAGGRTAVVGHSGSGKTTLLRLIAGFESPDRGQIRLDGEILADGPAMVPAHRRGIGIVAQDGALFPHLSVADNIGFGIGARERARGQRIAALAEMVGLDAGMLRRKPDELSGGQQQRVALARALARRPRLMLLDEPFSALDTALRAGTRKAVADLLGAAGIATVLVTHDQGEALSFADQVAVMRDGALVQVGDPRELYFHPRDAAVATFLGDAVILPAEIAEGRADCAIGMVPVPAAEAPGRARILLRPEQLTLTPAPQGSAPRLWRVAEVDFGGAVCAMVLRPAEAGASADPLPLRVPAVAIPPVGTTVRIDATGPAHVLRG